MSARGLLVGIGVLVLAFALFMVLMVRQAPVPQPTPTPIDDAPSIYSSETPEPFEPPEPEDEDLPLARIPVCCCENRYGDCINARMVREAARLHAIRHSHDLIGRGCASATEEDAALARMLLRPEQIEVNPRERLAMADRGAYRLRAAGR